jgi:L-lactate dehydrogenase complex protein LldG
LSGSEATLARIRAALGSSAAVPAIPRDYRVRGDLEPDAVAQLFAARVADYRATVHSTVASGLPALIATVLESAGASRVVVPSGLPAEWLSGLADLGVVTDDGSLSTSELDRFDAVVTGCAVAIAETGTIVLDAGRDQGRRVLTLLPDHHVCVVSAQRIVTTVPEGLARLAPTRPLTMISGPSATSDIELTRVEGVHGPRNLDVILLAR